MREIAQVYQMEQFHARGMKAVRKVQSIINSGDALQITVEDESGGAIMRFAPDKNFVNQALSMLKGAMKVIKECKIVVLNKQTALF